MGNSRDGDPDNERGRPVEPAKARAHGIDPDAVRIHEGDVPDAGSKEPPGGPAGAEGRRRASRREGAPSGTGWGDPAGRVRSRTGTARLGVGSAR